MREINMGLIVLGLSVIFLLCLPHMQNVINEFMDEIYIDIEHVGIVTDKWQRDESAFWIFGNAERYYLEINNDHTVKVDAFEYYNTEIDDYRNWTTTELRNS